MMLSRTPWLRRCAAAIARKIGTARRHAAKADAASAFERQRLAPANTSGTKM